MRKYRNVFFAMGTKIVICPFCNRDMNYSEMGVSSHLRKHVNEGLLDHNSIKDVRDTMKKDGTKNVGTIK